MNIKSMKMVTGPLLSMIENMVPKEEPANKEAKFAGHLIDTFFPVTEDEAIVRMKSVVTNIAIVAINRDPDSFRERLLELTDKLTDYFTG